MIGFYDYTVLLTYMGFISGIVGITLAINGHIFPAIFCLMFSGLCDMFDGRVARTKKKRTAEERHFGIQLDSLSDLVCFGVLPSIIGYSLALKDTFLPFDYRYLLPVVAFFPLAALIRLAYFNVLEITRNSNTPVKVYTGLPVTSSALIFPFLYIFRKYIGKYFPIAYAVVMLIVGILFITKIKIKKPGLKTMIFLILIGVIEIMFIIATKCL
ncbi:MAG: CDP-alcohol phosphatidyltransferase family protein [Tenericutes bacterium]|nr:CDP-alcohol phosphatidyltransferase family protein [Mycoplasmatota bacterium]